MKGTMKRWMSTALASLLLLGLTACGGASQGAMTESYETNSSSKFESSMDMEMPEEEMKEELGFENTITEDSAAGSAEQQDVLAGRKLIYTYRAEMQTLEFEETVASIESAVQKAGGYIEQSSRSGSGAIDYGRVYERTASYTLRIPAKAAGDFVAGLADIAAVTYSNQWVDDVTDYYYDSEARLNNLRVQETRLLELLAQAENMGDMITIEQALSDVRYQIESLDGTIRRLDKEIEFSSVDLYIQEVFEASQLQAAPLTLGERISARFSRSLEDIKDSGEDFIVWLIGDSVIILIWVVLISGAVVILRKVRGKLPQRKLFRRADQKETSAEEEQK